MTIGSRIKNKREKFNLTMQEVADAVGVSESTISRWEDGHIANMRVDKIEALATALKTTPAYLMGWEERAFNSDTGDYKTVLSTTIKHYREAANLSYADLSRLTDIPKATLHRYETNPTQKIPAASVLAIEKALNLSPGTLMLQESTALNRSEAWLRGYDVAMIPHTAELSPQESRLIEAYRNHPEVRLAVHRLLIIEQSEK